jgi:hypothetical protein
MLSIGELHQRAAKRAKMLDIEKTLAEKEEVSKLADLETKLQEEKKEGWLKEMEDDWEGRSSHWLDSNIDDSWKIYAALSTAAAYRSDGTCGVSDGTLIKWFVKMFHLKDRRRGYDPTFLLVDSSSHSSDSSCYSSDDEDTTEYHPDYKKPSDLN